MAIAESIANFTTQMESAKNPPSYKRAYQMLLLSMLEIRRLESQVNVLTDLNKMLQK